MLFLSNSINIYSQCEDDFTDWSDQNITMTVGDGSFPFDIIIDCIAVSNQDCPTVPGVITIDWSIDDPTNNPLPNGPTDFFIFNIHEIDSRSTRCPRGVNHFLLLVICKIAFSLVAWIAKWL